MLYIKNNSHDPYFNMAFDEYVVKNLDPTDDYFYFYQNCPSIIIGRNQNAISEVNLEYVKERGIIVVRRMSGGGAVYHDLGNINFAFVVNYKKQDFNSIERFARAVIKALEKLGINAQFTGRNDITIDGKKFSGNAQYVAGKRILHHGTLMFDSDLTVLSKALNVKPEKIISKGVKSVRSRVTNIKDYIKTDITIDEFKELLLKYVFEVEGSPLKEYKLTSQDLNNIAKLRNEKYATWEWNFGNAPEFDLTRSRRFNGGEVTININVEGGIIKNIKIYGDFLSMRDISDVENKIIGRRFEREDVREGLLQVDMREYFGSIKLEEFLSLF